VANRRYRESVRGLVADDVRELKEASRRAERANPSGYADTPFADRLREEMQRIDALIHRRDHRKCEHCGMHVAMRGARSTAQRGVA
jgi:hypothetical protein